MSLMQQFQSQSQQSSMQPNQPSQQLLDRLSTFRQIAQGNPNALMQSLMRSNPSFAQFVQQNKDKTPQQAFKDAGLDFDQVTRLLR